MMLGGVPEDFMSYQHVPMFTFAFNIIVFLLLLNFLYAIIVEAYLKVKEGQ